MEKLRIGVIGAGGIARTRMIPGILKSNYTTVTAIMGPHRETLERVAKGILASGGPEVALYTDAEALVASEDVDIVYIASPVFAHLEQVRLCAKYHKDVFCEKPLGLSVEEAEEMVRVCREAGIHAGAAFMMRFGTLHMQLRSMIKAGSFGKIISARAQQVFWYPENPKAWRQVKALGGGGALMDVSVHNIDLIEYLVGSRTASVTGFTETRTFSYDSDDTSHILIRLEDGTVAYIDGSFSEHSPLKGSLLEIYGTKGTVIIRGSIGQEDAGEAEGYVIGADGKRKPLELSEDFNDLYTKEIDAFACSVRNNAAEPVPLEQGLWIQKVSRAAYEAQETGRVTAVR